MTEPDLVKQAFDLREYLYRAYQQSYSHRLMRLNNKAIRRFVRRAELAESLNPTQRGRKDDR